MVEIDKEMVEEAIKKGMLEKKEIEESRKRIEKIKKDVEKFKRDVIKKYPFIEAIGILPLAANEKIIDEEELSKEEYEERKNKVHLIIIFPDEKVKEFGKIKIELIKKVNENGINVWLNFFSVSEIWEMCFDGKYDLVEAISMSFPLHDKGLLGALRVAQIHKNLVLRKFEKYVVSYVIAGSLVRGEATKTSDVDVYIIIDDTDVKRMSRVELKEKLRGIIYSYVIEASELAGVENKLSPQVYILTEFWEAVKDAHPVIFTFIRDGVPLYDRGTFMPWKLLLKTGKLKPSPEAIDMFMSMGDKMEEAVKRKLIDLVTGEIYWGMITPSQALLMLYGVAPPTPRETIREMKKIFVDKEKMLEKKYIDILEKVVKLYKDYEHDKLKEVRGEEIDKLLRECKEYMKRLKELREEIEKKSNEKIIRQLHKEVFELLQNVVDEKNENKILEKFKEKVRKGIFSNHAIKSIEQLLKVEKDIGKGKASKHEIEDVRKNVSILINQLTEYLQRKELIRTEKKIKIKTKNKTYDLIKIGDSLLLMNEKEIMKLNKDKFEKIKEEDLKNLDFEKKVEEFKIDDKIIEIIRKQFGNFELML